MARPARRPALQTGSTGRSLATTRLRADPLESLLAMDEEADRAAEAASAAAVGLPVEGWLTEALHKPVPKQLEEARRSTDIAFIQSA
eukprot:3889744-Alexandrium_andersonii.AAC.1